MAGRAQVRDVDHGWRNLYQRVQALTGGAYAKVGVLADSERGGLHEKDADGKASPLTVAEIAAVQEYGTADGRIPSRSFLRTTFDALREELIKDSQRLIVAVVIDGRMDAPTALNLLGLKLATQTKLRITETPLPGIAPINAPATRLAKAMKGRTGKFFAAQARNVGQALADVGVTKWASSLGYAGPGRRAVGAARNLGHAFAQVGALASVRTLVDSSRMVNAIAWALVFGDQQQPERYAGGGGG